MLLGLDLGTTNIKALLVEPSGRIVAQGAAPVGLLHVGDKGIEQDIEEIWAATLAAIGRLRPSGKLSDVRAVGVSSQGGAMQIRDGRGGPVGKVISWMDGRGAKHDQELTRSRGRQWFASHVGHGASGVALGQLLRLREESPRLLERPNRVAFVGDLIVERLCGRGAHDATSLAICILYNSHDRKADAETLALAGVAEDQLPALLSPRQAAGALLPQAAQATGLPAGIPVSPAVHDQYAAALGCGATNSGDVMFGAGTAWILLAAGDKADRLVIDDAFLSTHVVDGLYGQIVSLGNGGSSVSWACKLMGLVGPDAIEQALASAPAGADGVRFWPLLAPYGGAGLSPAATGRLLNLRLPHGPRHVLRAVVEGLALELNRYLQFLLRAGQSPARLVMCGGATASEVTPQIIADATGLSVACTSQSENSALGAAVLARGLLEPGESLAQLSRMMTHTTRIFEPAADRPLYRQLFSEYIESLPAVAAAQ